MIDVGQPPFPAEAVIQGDPMVIHTSAEVGMAAEKAPADGRYFVGDDGIPRKVRKGDPLPEGASFEAEAPAPKKGKGPSATTKGKGPSTNTEGSGPSETV